MSKFFAHNSEPSIPYVMNLPVKSSEIPISAPHRLASAEAD